MYHRMTYMGERYCYYKRQDDAQKYPKEYLSDISDGMASSKTVVTSCSDQYEFKPNLNMHVRLSYPIFF